MRPGKESCEARRKWGEGKEVGRIGEGIIGKVIKKAGKERRGGRVGKEGKEIICVLCQKHFASI